MGMKKKLILSKNFKGSFGMKDFKKIKQSMDVYSERQAQQKAKAEADFENFNAERDLNLLSSYEDVLEKITLNKNSQRLVASFGSPRKSIHESKKRLSGDTP